MVTFKVRGGEAHPTSVEGTAHLLGEGYGQKEGKGEWGGREMDWEFGVGRCKLLHLEWINKVLLYSTGNCIQSPGINHNEKEY